MVSVKKRKLDGGASGSGSGSSTPTAMSAFAARQQLWGAAATRAAVVLDKGTPEPPEDATRSRKDRSETPSARSAAACSSKRQAPKTLVSDEAKQTQATSVDGGSGPTTPRPESGGMSLRQHSSFKANKKSLQRKAGGRLVLAAPEAERLVILGSYGIKVREGEATITGAILTPSDGIQWVHAPLCHGVPVLRTADETVLELQPHPAAKGLRQLAKLNPAFARLWNEIPGPSSKSNTPASFQIIYTSEDVSKRAVLQELVSPAEWNKKLSGLATAKRKGTPVIFLCGPKSSGKSTFGRLLANRFMTDRGGSKNNPWSDVMVLDIDPGQPEYSPAGVISLTRITAPNLSPSFCHPTLSPAEGQLRAHAIASITPAQDPAHFIECVLDLFHYYQRGPDAKSPLVINTPGWIQGTGLDILTELITSLHPTEVIYTSQDGPHETVSSLQSACTSTTPPTPFSTLPSQPTEPSSSRTSLHFRTMQTMSYFHLQQPSQQQPYPTWDPTPLTDLRPWRVRYAGKDRGFLGILCYDHQPAPELLAEAINGTVLALVKLEDRDVALGGLVPPGFFHSSQTEADTATDTDTDHPPPLPDTGMDSAPTTSINPTNDNYVDNAHLHHTHRKYHHHHHTPPAPLPLIPNPQGQTLSPAHSHLLGLVLVRGIDPAHNELQLLTPLSHDVVAGLKGEDLVLVAGRFDTPHWVYSEGLYSTGNRKVVGRGGGSGGGGGEMGGAEDDDQVDEDAGSSGDGSGDEEGDGSDDEGVAEGAQGRRMEVPWVEMLHGSQKRAAGSKVWRVRRDLGRG